MFEVSDVDSIDPMDPAILLSQLPLQSEIDEMGDISIVSSSNLDIDATENDEMIIKISRQQQRQQQQQQQRKKDIRLKGDLINQDDDTDDTDLDDIQKPINNDLMMDRKPWYYKPINWLKLNLIFFLLALLISGLSQPAMLWNLLQIFLEWMEGHLLSGSFVFITLYIICDLLMLPCLIFTLGAGFVYCNVLHSMIRGLFLSTFIVVISELIGSTIAFLLARYLLRKTIKKIASKYPKFTLIDKAVKKHGFKVTLLFRMSPVTPYNLLNYFMGLTSVRFIDYSMAAIGILPNFFLCCLVGGSIHHIYQLSQIDITSNIPLLIGTIIGILFIIFLIIYGTRFIRRELAKISIQMKQEQDILSINCHHHQQYHDEQLPLTEIDIHHIHQPDISNIDDIVSIDLVSSNIDNDDNISNLDI